MKTPKFPVVPALLACVCLVAAGCSSKKSSSDYEESRRAEFDAKRTTHVVVTISSGDKVRVDNARCSPQELPDVLKSKGRLYAGRPVLLLVQSQTKADAVTFVRKHASAANLGPVEVMIAD